MKLFTALAAFVCIFLPVSAHALSCAWPSIEEAKKQYPVTVLGEVTESTFHPLPDGEKHMLMRGHQQVTMKIEQFRAPEGTVDSEKPFTFREVITMYDRSFFKPEKRYVVFLERGENGELRYPVCGFHLVADDPMLDMQQVKEDMGWE